MKNNFDDLYKKEKCVWGMKPSPLVEQILNYKTSGKVLDLGCGEGRNAIFLAKKGFDVTAIDISKEAIKKLKLKADEYGVGVDTRVGDITKIRLDENYDVVISNAVLHFLKEQDIKEAISKIKNATRINGLNTINVFTEDNPEKNFPNLFKKGELKSYYEDWRILFYKEFMTPLEKHGENGKLHRHGVALLMAEKL